MRKYNYDPHFIGEETTERAGNLPELAQLREKAGIEPRQLLTPAPLFLTTTLLLAAQHLSAQRRVSLSVSFMRSCLSSLGLCTALKKAAWS